MLKFFEKKPKEKLDCLGYFDCKPFEFFESNLQYINEIQILKNEDVAVYSRLFKKTLFVVTLVINEESFDKTQYNYEALKEKIDSVIIEEHTAVINIIIFKNKNEKTIQIALEPVKNTRKEFYQTLVYDGKRVSLNYYRPVPDFYRLYDDYIEVMFYDLAAIAPTR